MPAGESPFMTEKFPKPFEFLNDQTEEYIKWCAATNGFLVSVSKTLTSARDAEAVAGSEAFTNF
jgi:hypothetical protein